MTIPIFLAGLAFLIAGAEALVRGASRLAGALNISSLIIGLTVVAFGTSSPELAVSIKAALAGQAEIAAGNVIGSNIFNVLFILGVSALIAPLVVSQQLVRLDVPLMLGLSVLTLALGLDGSTSRIEGFVLCTGLVAYTWFLVRQSRREGAELRLEYAREFGSSDDETPSEEVTGSREEPTEPSAGRDVKGTVQRHALSAVLVIGGLVLLVLGSRWLVDSAITFATYLGVSEVVVALTIVAAGTSLPEVVTSIVAAVRGERDIAVGNVVGSNIFNIMGVLGLASFVAPNGLTLSPALLGFDVPIMIVVAFACLPIFFTGGRISRPEGAVLLGFYVAYTTFLIMASAQHAALPYFSAAMLYFAVPLSLLTVLVIAARELQARRS